MTTLTWHDVIGNEKQQEYFQQTMAYVEAQRTQGKVIFPPAQDVFNAFRFTEFSD
ncbi:uracil-DNA glycosylase, partial [Vibrio alfacsensis]